jgi:hypothetical protein
MLGGNKFEPENPEQRPFEWQMVMAHMENHDVDPHTGAKLKAYPGAAPTPQILAPSIKRMYVVEQENWLILEGDFGQDQDKVTVGGSPRPIVSWAPDKIVVTLALSGQGSSGDVEVTVKDHKSNVRQLTEWAFTMQYNYTLPGPLTCKGPIHLRFRADVGSYRTEPGATPIYPPYRNATATRDSHSPQLASGTITDGNCTSKWTGAPDFVAGGFDPNDKQVLLARLRIDPKNMTGDLGIAFGAPSTGLPRFTIDCIKPPSHSDELLGLPFGLIDGQVDFEDPAESLRPPVRLFAFHFNLASDFTIPGRDYKPATLPTLNVKWTAATPKTPPDPFAARSAALPR